MIKVAVKLLKNHISKKETEQRGKGITGITPIDRKTIIF